MTDSIGIPVDDMSAELRQQVRQEQCEMASQWRLRAPRRSDTPTSLPPIRQRRPDWLPFQTRSIRP